MSEIIELMNPVIDNIYPKQQTPVDGELEPSYHVKWYWNLTGGQAPPDKDAKLPVPYLQLHGREGVTDIEQIKLSDYQVLDDNMLVTSLTVSYSLCKRVVLIRTYSAYFSVII